MSLRSICARARLVVCIGTGGVGKTSLSAAIALSAARTGRRAAVLTIDPARALGRALGIAQLSTQIARIDPALLAQAGLATDVSLHAGMLEQQGAWDAFVRRHAPSDAAARALLDNPFYRQLSRRFSGSTEYVALEELCRLHESGEFDLIVLDTPPAAHALDFVYAPARVDRLLDSGVVGLLTGPHPRAATLLHRLQRATGRDALREVTDFAAAFGRLSAAIRRRSAESRALLWGEQTAFVLVAGPEPDVLRGAESLRTSMRQLGLSLSAVVQNRVQPHFDGAQITDAERVLAALSSSGVDDSSVSWLRQIHADAACMARTQQTAWKHFTGTLPDEVARARVPLLGRDVNSVGDLLALSQALFTD